MQPLPTKLILRKKRAREGKSSEEVEHFPVPRTVTIRRRPNVAVMELRDEGVRKCSLLLILLIPSLSYIAQVLTLLCLSGFCGFKG